MKEITPVKHPVTVSKHVSLLLFVLVLIALMACGCARPSSPTLPDASQFETVLQLNDTSSISGQPIQVFAGLRNDSGKPWKIHHNSPLIIIEIHGPEWEDYEPKINLATDQVKTLNAREMYDPDTANFIEGKRLLRLDTPGSYTLVGVAQFRIQDSTGNMKNYTVRSEPLHIQVAPAYTSRAPQP